MHARALVAAAPGLYSGLDAFSFTDIRVRYPPTDDHHARRLRFERLARRWRRETRFSSSVATMIAHPAYREIIAMGHAAVPLIIEALGENPDHWHAALVEITKTDPVPEEAYGDLELIAEAWLGWWDHQTA